MKTSQRAVEKSPAGTTPPPRAARSRRAAAGKGGEAPVQAVAPAPDLGEWIRTAAYFRAERRGFAAGAELDDWIEAEQEVMRSLANGAAGEPGGR